MGERETERERERGGEREFNIIIYIRRLAESNAGVPIVGKTLSRWTQKE